MNNIKYEALSPLEIAYHDDILQECSILYSSHYGVWSDKHPNENMRGKNIKLSKQKLNRWFDNNISWLYIARNEENKIIGYAIAFNCKIENMKSGIAWVTQLVVHREYRKSDVAKNLLYSIWGESKNFAWGIVSANPYAIRALEKATRRRSNPNCIEKEQEKIFIITKEYLSYVDKDTEFKIDKKHSSINTKFYVEHKDIPEMLRNVVDQKKPWLLGDLDEGWEWIGVTFNRQKQINLSVKEITEMIETSDMVTKQAYARMQVTSSNHRWMSHTNKEVDFIIKEASLNSDSLVLDFGCGIGRHSLGLAQKGIHVKGIDYVKNNIKIANESIPSDTSNVEFIVDDCRYYSSPQQADAIICLYDVIGSFVEEKDNELILKNICKNVKQGGTIIISVMNFELTNFIAKNRFSFMKQPNELLKLEASRTMETTGDIFDPDYFIVDKDTHIVYRKERFEQGRELPIELIVRDRRYTLEEIKSLCLQHNLKVEFARFVNAKDWDKELDATDMRAKEILIKCTKL